MRNPTEIINPILIWSTLLLLLALPIYAVDSESDNGERVGEWHILTKLNFSSQIRHHPHILLMVTVPWCGESRSLMKELSDAIIYEQERFGALKLRLLYRNIDRTLADALGATEGITIFYYHQELSYKYRGRLRVQNVLSSFHHVISLLPEELPLKFINTPEDFRVLVASTDKALLLLELCGWTPKLLVKDTKNSTEAAAGGYSGSIVSKETNATLALKENDRLKVVENDKIQCDSGEGATGIPLFHEFISVNDSLLLDGQNMTRKSADTCSFEEFKHFEKSLPKFLSVVREFFLPPEKLRFGVIRDRSLLSLLNVEYSGSWSVTLHEAGCSSCSKVFKEVDDLKTVLQSQLSPVMELEDHIPDIQPALPANRPSVLLFIDRSSDVLNIREQSVEALGAFRELAVSYQVSHQFGGRANVKPPMSPGAAYKPPSMFKHHGLELFSTHKEISQKDKVSIMILDEGKQVNVENLVPDLQGSSLQEILAYVLERKKQLKLSSLAKDSGFQLLSEDVDIKFVEAQPAELPSEGSLQGGTDLRDGQTSYVDETVDVTHEEKPKPPRDEPSKQDDEKNSAELSSHSVQSDGNHQNEEISSGQANKIEGETITGMDEQIWDKSSWVSFFFSDGNYRFLKTLTGGSNIPSVVIIDPNLQQHYVFPEHTVSSMSLISKFLQRFLNGSIPPYQQSEPEVSKTRKAPSPPFINLNFHEVDSVPRVTTRTFEELVFGNPSESGSADKDPNRDVLVLFSNSWCGFCQRMELVVREVYRAIRRYADLVKEDVWSEKPQLTSDVKKTMLKTPSIYLMDCTLNDCSLILKSMVQRELYPFLLLFQAGRKSPVAYEGDITVADIIKFLTDNGSLFRGLVGEIGLLHPGAELGGSSVNLWGSTLAKSTESDVLLSDRIQKVEKQLHQFTSQSIIHTPETNIQAVVGSVLVATDRLLDAHPFDESKILIVKADPSAGYQGLIVNKPISWDSLEELEEGLLLLKEAPLSFGGPVMKHGMPLVTLSRKCTKDQCLEVLPNTYFLDQSATSNLLEELKSRNQSVYDYWFFLGFSSWGWHQLSNEIDEGAWNVTEGNTDILDWPWR